MGLDPIKIAINAVTNSPLGQLLGLESEDLPAIRKGFNFGYIFEIIDIRAGSTSASVLATLNESFNATVTTHVMVLPPMRYTLSEPFSVTLTPAEDNQVIAEEYGHIIREITLEGTYGYGTKRVTGFAGVQSAGAAPANSHFLHLRKIFRDYAIRKKDPVNGPYTRMIFHSLREDDHFVVIPRSFETPRDAKRGRIHYDYRIKLAVVGTSARVFEEDQGIFGMFDDAIQAVGEVIADSRAFFAELNVAIEEIKTRVRDIENILFNTAGLINDIHKFGRNNASFIRQSPKSFKNTLARVEEASIALNNAIWADSLTAADFDTPERKSTRLHANQLAKMEQALTTMTMFEESFLEPSSTVAKRQYAGENSLTRTDIERGEAGAGIGSLTRIQGGSAKSSAGLQISDATGFINVVVKKGTTIRSLSSTYNVSEETIIFINDLRPPYIAAGGGPGIKKPGDTVMVPVPEAGSGSNSTTTSPYMSPEELAYGSDLLLDPELMEQGLFDLKLNTTHGSTDVERVKGVKNVVQGLQIILQTEKGNTVHVPTVGLRKPIGLQGTLQEQLFATTAIQDGILTDPRVAEIASNNVSLVNDVLYMNVTPVLKSSRSGINLQVPIGRAKGAGT